MTTEFVDTKICKTFTLSEYRQGTHVTKGYISLGGRASFAESLSPLEKMIEAFDFRPLGTKIRVTMVEVG